MLKQNKGKLIISSILILLPALVGVLLWNKLPMYMTTHWGADGNADGWSGKAFAVFGLPLILLVVHWICMLFTAKDPGNTNQSRKVFSMVLWIMPIISFFANGVIYYAAFGRDFHFGMITFLPLGLMFVILGNYLPKCRQNHTIGIKIKWTLENEENWNATHRFCGKVWVIGGLLMMACIFLPEATLPWVVTVLILGLVGLSFAYSYLYYKKQVKAGTYVRNGVWSGKSEKKVTVISMILLTMILIFVVVICFTGDIHIQYGEDAFTIKASYYNDLTVEYAAIDSIEYRDEDEAGGRISGFGSPRLSLGGFRNEEFGSYTRYAYTQCDACVVLTVDSRTLVLSGKDADSTKEIYEELLERL